MVEPSQSLDFPPRRKPVAAAGPALARRGLSLRAAETADLPFLQALFASFRADEMAMVAWPDAAKAGFLQSQFRLQHTHFTTHFAGGDFMVIERDRRAAGRLYLDWREREVLVVDIGFMPEHRGAGLGEAVLKWLATMARERGLERVSLHVTLNNPRARKLYEKLGFKAGMVEGQHLRMALPLKRVG
ncbi:MAG: GNAT family N-acetyltransferase [Proteobacteria bacterium]|nr:GNAT family N-acetyltransferase [Pseudomonadota bacterium]